MNKKKYLDKIDKKVFIRSGIFKKVCLVNETEDICIEVQKIKTKEDIVEYVSGLQSFINKAFLIYPCSYFSTENFKTDVDVVLIDNSFRVVAIYNKLPPNKKILFEGEFYNVLLIQPGLARWYEIKPGEKFNLTKNL